MAAPIGRGLTAKGCVLLVDDDSSMLLALKHVVTWGGWVALLARSGPEALALARHAEVVVTDYSMPGLDGIELIGAIRGRDATIPVVLLSGEGSRALSMRAMQAGAYQCLTKPFDTDELLGALAGASEARRLRAERAGLQHDGAVAGRHAVPAPVEDPEPGVALGT